MSHRICCYTLFDITQTGVLNRSKPQGADVTNWLQRRNTQCNFDTILQVISLRSQPEVIKHPHSMEFSFDQLDKFGFLYQQEGETLYNCWKFVFEVQHNSVFEDGITPFGSLYRDCSGVPMIICPTQYDKTSSFLDISPELRNIYFEVV